MVHHRVIGNRNLCFARKVIFRRTSNFLRNQILVNLKPYLFKVNMVVIAQIINLDFAVMVLSEVLDDISYRIPVQTFHTFAGKAHSKYFFGNLGHIEIKIFVLISFSILRNHFLDICFFVRALFRLPLVDVLVDAVVLFLGKVVHSRKVYCFCI